MFKPKKYIEKLCLSGVFAALYFGLELIANQLSIPLFAHKIELPISSIALCVIALYCGPWWGAGTAVIGGFLAQLCSPYGLTPTTPLWLAPAVLQAVIIGLTFKALSKTEIKQYFSLFIAVLIGQISLTLFNSVALYADGKIYGYPTEIIGITLLLRFIVGCGSAAVFAWLCIPIFKLLRSFKQ